jgi:putative sigma-54 modulation protein
VSRRAPAVGAPLPLVLSGRGVSLTPALRRLVEDKLARLPRVRPSILDARVVCTAEKFRRTVRITLRARRRTFASEATAPDLATAVDAAIEALRRQTRKAKDRRTARRGPLGPDRGPLGPLA